jgi:hypothetical protein
MIGSASSEWIFGMAVLSLFAPAPLVGSGNGDNWVTQFISNPWGVSAVWIQCTVQYISGGGETDFGNAELDFLDNQGNFQQQIIADDNSIYGALWSVAFVPQLLGVTVAAHTFDGVIRATTTLFEWG